jgi:hypothetical protein
VGCEIETSKSCYCDYLYGSRCVICDDLRIRQEDHEVCSQWNWNLSPRECADDARERGWTVRRVITAMTTFGFTEGQIHAVRYEMEIGE